MSRRFEFVKRLLDECVNDQGVLKNEYGMVELPRRSTEKSAGYDFFVNETTVCKAHEITMVKTGVKAYMEDNETLLLFNRSSNPKKKGLIILNGVGVIDAKAA